MSKYPEDQVIKETFLKIEEEYNQGGNWNLRITADTLDCPISYVRSVLQELESKGEL